MVSKVTPEVLEPSGNIHCWLHKEAKFVLHEDGKYYCTECIEVEQHLRDRELFS